MKAPRAPQDLCDIANDIDGSISDLTALKFMTGQLRERYDGEGDDAGETLQCLLNYLH
jgi:hypothetical protein